MAIWCSAQNCRVSAWVEVGVHLDLVHRRGDLALLVQPPQVVRREVRDADRARPSVAVELLERVPRLDEVAVVAGGQRPVDQEQVDVVGAELVEGLGERLAGVVGPVEAVVQLAGDEDVAAVEAGLGQRLADLLLVLVHLGRVDVPVTGLERGQHRLDGVLRLDLERRRSRTAGSSGRC